MKKWAALFLIPLFCLLCLFPALAASDESFTTAGDLFQHWMNNHRYPESPYPSYICGVWSTDGGMTNLTFAVTDDAAGEAGKSEILSMVEQDDTVAFSTQRYSYTELNDIHQSLVMDSSTGIVGSGILEMDNCVYIGLDDSNPNSWATAEKLTALYGDRVSCSLGSGVFVQDNAAEDLSGEEAPSSGSGFPTWVLILTISLIVIALGLFLECRRRKKN